MKTLIFFIMVSISFSVKAQDIHIQKRKPWEEAKLKWLLRDTLNKIGAIPKTMYSTPQQVKNGVYQIPITGKFIGDNGRGDEIYAMQPDNMPCLVPGKSFTSEMPVLGFDQSDKTLLPQLKKGDKKPGEDK